MHSPRRSDYDPVQLSAPDDSYSSRDAPQSSINMPEQTVDDGNSYSSHTPFANSPSSSGTYPPRSPPRDERHVRMPSFPVPGETRSKRPRLSHVKTQGPDGSMGSSRNSSWDLLAGVRKWEESYDQFDARTAGQKHLAFADGDIPKNTVRYSIAPRI